MWTKETLQQLIKDKMGDYLFVVVSNRQPFVHVFKKGRIECQRGVGGVISAIDPVMRACQGIWVALSSGDADYHISRPSGKLKVPEDDPRYLLKRIWINKEEEQGYYYGYSNDVLWPLCHLTFQRPTFRQEDWHHYQNVNQKFAQAVLEEIGDRKAFVWIQDYHLCLLPKYLKEKAPNQIITAHFWHIPWPSFEIFRICPQRKELLEGLLANDLMGFHTRYHCNNFVDVIDRELECKIDRERFSIVRNNHETLIRPYPVSVDFEGINNLIESSAVRQAQNNLVEEFNLTNRRVMIGLDRIDYTKGILERLWAVDLLLEKHPEFRKQIVFLQIGVLSRLHLAKYKALNDQINAVVEGINWKYATEDWKPVIFIRDNYSLIKLLALYRISEVGIVSSLHDGMNLVAKEYVSSRNDEQGVLVLSQFTGAARELTDAILINPYDQEGFAEGIYQALTLSEEERKKRMIRMREVIATQNIFRWAGKIISDLLRFEFKE